MEQLTLLQLVSYGPFWSTFHLLGLLNSLADWKPNTGLSKPWCPMVELLMESTVDTFIIRDEL